MIRILKNSKDVLRYLFFIGFALLIYYAIPKEGKFKYEYKKYEVWQHEDLIAPFSFPINKSEEELEQEKEQIKNKFRPYYILHSEVKTEAENKFKTHYESFLKYGFDSLKISQESIIYKNALELIRYVYKKGIIELNEQHLDKDDEFRINLLSKNNILEDVALSDMYHTEKIKLSVTELLVKDSLLLQNIKKEEFLKLFKQNITYDADLSEKELNDQLEQISLTKGLIEEGEKIIAKGVKISPEKYQILESLRSEYEIQLGSNKSNYLLLSGYLLLVLLIFIGFAFYLNQFYKRIFKSNKDALLIFITITLFILIATYAVKISAVSIYLVPFCIVPIIILSFYDSRIAFVSHLVTIIVSSIFAPNGYEFLLIQTLAGMAVIIGISKVKYLSQFFVATLIILLVYYISYFGIKLIQSSSISEIDFTNLLWFTGSFILTLLAYPLVYAYEKIFGLLSDISLIELSDINKSLLRDLSHKAPGTFQHSLQVANLSEAVLNSIGGNALLARVGALYHDIGKMHAPMFFTENQKDENPHDKLNEKESARIIIDHVAKGIELAKANNLPKEIISFVRTHHGTSRTEYFYRSYVNKHPEEKVDDKEFRYPGPKPSTKEQAVVMIVDTVEAASRSLKKPTPEMLEELVDKLVEHKLNDNQFEVANISINDIRIAKDILKEKLKSIYHSRIEYPKDIQSKEN